MQRLAVSHKYKLAAGCPKICRLVDLKLNKIKQVYEHTQPIFWISWVGPIDMNYN